MNRKAGYLLRGASTLALALAACGQFSGSGGTTCANSALLGTWSVSGETIAFFSSCAFTSSICNAHATASNAVGNPGSVSITGWSVSSPCTSQADRSCTYTITGTTLQLSCTPNGGGTYSKQ